MKGEVTLPLEEYNLLKKAYDNIDIAPLYREYKYGYSTYSTKTESELVKEILKDYSELIEKHVKTLETLHESHKEIVRLELKINKEEKPLAIIDRVLDKFGIK